MEDKKSDRSRFNGNPAWVKGQSGNPAGRPKGSKNKQIQALDDIGFKNAEEIVRLSVSKAKRGDPRFCDIILKRAWPERKGRPLDITLPSITTAADIVTALASLIQAVGDGRVTPEEAQAVASVIELQRKALETVDHEARLQALEDMVED